MTHRKLLAALLLAALGALPATAQVDTGVANFTRFVALGDSLTQGNTNGGVVQGVQVNSFPALIARQAGVTGFEQPLITPPGIPALLTVQNLRPPVIVPRPGVGAPANLNLPRPYNNLAVSGFDVRDVVVTRTGNPLIDLTLRGLGTALEQAAALQPTFVSLWLGNNDVLGAATSGIVIDGVTLTPVAQFETDLRAIVNTFRAMNAGILLATIPDVTAIPFVTTIPAVVVNPTTGQPVLGPNGQPIPLIGPAGPLNPAADRVLLSASAELAQGRGLPPALGGTGPLSDSAVLSAGEIAVVGARVTAFNNVIRAVAAEAGAALWDANAFFQGVVQNGFPVGGIDLTPAFLTGGVFGYDGVHPTPLGYAIAANEMIRVLNQHFGGRIPLVDLTPFLFGPAGSAGAIFPPGTPVATSQFTAEAEVSLRSVLRIPSKEELERIKNQGGGDGPRPPRPDRPRRVLLPEPNLPVLELP
jgi:lysophospholipase L1-like esterase